MPTISMFFGIYIRMYPEKGGKHNVPYIHAEYGEYEASMDFDGCTLEGGLPAKQRTLVSAWIIIHKEELQQNWIALMEGMPTTKIKPLD